MPGGRLENPQMTISADDIEKLAAWSAPKEINTKRGPRLLRKADPTDALNAATADKAGRDTLYAFGVSIGWDNYAHKTMATWWMPIPEAVVVARAESVIASRAASADLVLPAPAGLDYLPFQKAGIGYALQRQHCLIADDMGLGKTIQAIGIINASPDILTALIVCPKSLKRNWYLELTKWLTRPLSVGVADGGIWPQTDIVIVNYEGVKKYKGYIQARAWSALVLDEAHYIKNSKAERSAMIKGRAADEKKGKAAIEAIRADHHIRLSGTPFLNRPIELHNVIADLDPMWANFFSYAKRYCNAYQKRAGKRMVWDFSGSSNLDELQRKLRESIMVRRLKADVLTELPAKRRQVIELDPDGAIMAALEAEREAEAGLSDAAIEDEELAFEEYSAARHDTAMAKVPAVIEHLESFMDEDDTYKVIVGAHHRDVIAALAEACQAKGWHPVYLTGETSIDARQAAVDAFQNDSAIRVFIGSILAAGVGLTLTASSHVVFAELDWVPGNLTQFEDRAHRIGQRDTVLVQHLVISGSIDSKFVEKIVAKQNVITAALDTETKPVPAYVAPAPRAPRVERQVAPAITAEDVKDMQYFKAESDERERAEAAPSLTAEQVVAIHAGLRLLAGMDADRAAERNGQGFNKLDGTFGHSLAGAARLSDKQAAAGLKLVRKYRRQLPADLLAEAGIK